MAEYFEPTQSRYNDPYQQLIFDYGTVDSRVYLSRATNMILKAMGNNVICNGFNLAVSGVGTSIATVTVGTGYAIQDSTLIQSTQVATLTINVSTLSDTTTGGAHLGIFIDYEYLESVVSNPMNIRLYHISSDGMTITPAGFDTARCLTLVGVVDFTKPVATITAISVNVGETLSVYGSTKYIGGFDITNNINFAKIAASAARQTLATVSSWTLDTTFNGLDMYYADVTVGPKYNIQCYNTSNEIVFPHLIDRISEYVIRIWMPTNTVTLKVYY